ncbi:MAG: 1-deoxy-D-xylulose-5-phosphate synthase [Coriobacteriales bacterium]|nr:1-deoxy-D-xylulose-5-phosphate synthase [Coriobacteriales bacterium]
MGGILQRIQSPADVRRLSLSQLNELADEVRAALIRTVVVTGGHLGPNLGFVEATIALHHVFGFPTDKIVFDVSHQCYTHKMLTGRKRAFLDESHYGEFTGFTNPNESEYDLFRAGHTSQSVSLACGLAKARDLQGARHNVIAVLGDGSLSGGEAFEGLDNAAELGGNLIVVFNDNDMSIAPNSGGVYANLAELRASNGACEQNFFRALGLDYRYVENGNSVEALVAAFEQVRDIDHPIVVHIHTTKGKGYEWAERNPEAAHMIPPMFDPKASASAAKEVPLTYQQITRDYLSKKMAKDKSVVVVNAGAPSGVGLTPEFRASCGAQFVDTGITEQHAAAFSAGLARGGAKPVFMVMATFAQRAFDQFVQELGLNRSPATVLIFGAGFYDIDATHAGTFDVVLTGNVPGITCLAPATRQEYLSMLDWSIDQSERPVVIRVPEKVLSGSDHAFNPKRPGGWHVVERGKGIAFLSLGSTVELAHRASSLLHERDGISASIIEALNYSSFDEPLLDSLLGDHDMVVTLEAGILCGGFGEKVARYFGKTPMRVLCYGGKKEFLDRVPTEEFFKIYHFTPEDIAADIEALLAQM